MTDARPTIRDALARVHTRVTMLAASLSAVAILIVGYIAARDYAQQELNIAAEAASYTVEAALVFDDRTAMGDALRPMTENGEIGTVVVVGADGDELFAWRSDVTGRHFVGERYLRRIAMLAPVTRPVMHQGRRIGEVRMTGSAEGLTHFLLRGLIAIAISLVVIAFVSRLLARRLQNGIAVPLSAIARVAHEVREQRAFERRVPGAEIHEINSLGEDFNALLDEIQRWQASVQSEHESLAYRAMHDPLTGLPNRAFFETQVERAVEEAMRTRGRLGLLYMDGDDFKLVNDRYGHAMGDALLVELAGRIKSCAGRDDLVARLGGDEFVVLLTGEDADTRAAPLAAAIEAAMMPEFVLPEGQRIKPAVSIGKATFPEEAHDAATLVRRADLGMYLEKQRRERASGARE